MTMPDFAAGSCFASFVHLFVVYIITGIIHGGLEIWNLISLCSIFIRYTYRTCNSFAELTFQTYVDLNTQKKNSISQLAHVKFSI